MESDRNVPRKARLFWNGRSQAVRLPVDFRFEGDEVLIRRDGEAVVLEPVPQAKWPRGFWSWIERRGEELALPDVEPLQLHFGDASESADV